MTPQFMLSDLLEAAKATILFTLVLLVPGYVAGWSLDLLSFKRRSVLTRMVMAVPLSIGLCPVITYLLGRCAMAAVWVLYVGAAITFAALLVRKRGAHPLIAAIFAVPKARLAYCGLVAAWGAIAVLTLIDLQIGHRLYFPTVTYDYAFRSSVTSAISRTGIPPHNPIFFPGHPFNLRYHYFWFILCSVVQQIGGKALSPRVAMIAGTVWAGIGLLALVPLYLRFFLSAGRTRIDRRVWLGVALLGVTGLDIVPVMLLEYISKGSMASIEWWNDPVTAWIHAVLWVPHHVAGLTACLMGFLLIWDAGTPQTSRQRLVASATAGAMFASAIGLSIYVTSVFASFLAVWMVVSLLRNNQRHARQICIAGLSALLLSIPYLLELFGQSSSAPGAGAFPLQFAVKPFRVLDIIMGFSGPSDWRANLAHLVVLPVNYTLEFGFFLIVGVAQCKRMWRTRQSLTEDELCGFTMAATSILVCTFVRSTVIANNDLGWRGMLIAQFVLLLWGVEFVNGGLRRGLFAGGNAYRVLTAMCLVLGLAGSVYEVVKVRFNPFLSDYSSHQIYKWLSPDGKLGERTYAMRQLYEELQTRTTSDAVYQHNPNTDPEDLFNGSYGDRQVASETMTCGSVFGGNSDECGKRIGRIDSLFEDPGAYSASMIDGVCRELSINILVVKDTDPVWRDRGSWVWNRKPLIANSYVRSFNCGTAAVLWSSAK